MVELAIERGLTVERKRKPRLTIEPIQKWTETKDVYSMTKLDLSYRNLTDVSPLVELTQQSLFYRVGSTNLVESESET